MVNGQKYPKHRKGIESRILVDRVVRTEKGCILWLCVDLDAEESMVRNDGTVSLGFVWRVKFQAVGLGPSEKLEQHKERL